MQAHLRLNSKSLKLEEKVDRKKWLLEVTKEVCMLYYYHASNLTLFDAG